MMEQLFDPAFYAREIAAGRLWLEENALSLSIATLRAELDRIMKVEG